MPRKKKIGIVTFWESNDNYGQQLQCWALQHYLREKGYNAFLIRQYIFPRKKRCIKRIKQVVKNALHSFFCASRLAYNPLVHKCFSFCIDKDTYRRKFPLFRQRYIKMTRIYTPEELLNNPPKAEMYITGSDQVWNCNIPLDNWKSYFLQFGDERTKRVAYAPSMTIRAELNNRLEYFRKYLSSFDAISAREQSTVDLCKQLGFNATVVVDPTLLLDIYQYRALYQDMQNKIVPNSIFIYSLNYSHDGELPIEAIKEFAAKEKHEIVVTPGTGYSRDKEDLTDVIYRYFSIEEWLCQIESAKLVVTASFHGVVISILFHKPFIYTPLSGEFSMGNNRILDLLETLKLNSCIWDRERSVGSYLENQIDWGSVNSLIRQIRAKSYAFLETALKEI